MPNWCSNKLTISTINESKEAKEQLEKFIDDITEEGEKVSLEKASEYREKFLQDNFETRYSEAPEVFVHHSEMDIKDFMSKVVLFSYIEDEKEFVKGYSEFTMQKLLPVPMELLHPEVESYGGPNAAENERRRQELKKKFGYQSWYDWRIANWGTKWDITDVYSNGYEDDENSVEYSFSTAWSPPTNFFKTIASNYPLLKFELEYEEPGCAFEGTLIMKGGEEELDETRDWVQKTCYSCGEELDEGEKFDEEGYCPDCSYSEEDGEEE